MDCFLLYTEIYMKPISIFTGFLLIFLLLSPFVVARGDDSFRQEIKTRVQERRQERQENREEFRAQIQTIRDERKREIVEKLNDKLSSVNERATDHWVEVLEKLEGIVARIDTKAQDLEGEGIDISQVEAAITVANNAIATAQSAVSSQAGKTYEITITDENNLRGQVGPTVSGLHQDLRHVHQTVVAAKQAVMQAAMELAKAKE